MRLNMLLQQFAKQTYGDMTVIWYRNENIITFTMIPAGTESMIPQHRMDRNADPSVQGIRKALNCNFNAVNQDSAIQYKIMGDSYAGGFSAGLTMKNSGSIDHLRKPELKIKQNGAELIQKDDRGLEFRQTISWKKGQQFLKIQTSVANKGKKALTLEYMPSFSLGMLSLFQPDDGPECYEVCRWLSNWSNEGRCERNAVEELGLESSWAGFGMRILRFGEQGSMPIRGYFPQVGFRDRKAKVCWGCAIDADASWELEVSRSQDFFHISGGYVDREFGQWTKELRPGESFTAPEAALTCVKGDIEDMQNRLVHYCDGPLPESEKDLPVMFNDWCTSWGKPYPETLLPIAKRLSGRDILYFVLDDGWFKNRKDPKWPTGIGDWNVSPAYGRKKLKGFLNELRKLGFIPGIWFEFENATGDAHLLKEHPEMFLHLDGQLLNCGGRSFLDFRRPDVKAYLKAKVIDFLKENNIGYMKVDYNSSSGIGCDGAGSKPEELRLQTLSLTEFYEYMRKELPDLVLEICSSGGHRLSPAWMRRACMGSFSDAHEGVEIPLIAANTSNLIPVCKNQIWAVLHGTDNETRLCYSLAAGFLGRLCLSGDIAGLSAKQNALVDQAVKLYYKAVPVLKDGFTHTERHTGLSYLHPRGWQLWERKNDKMRLAVVHTFAEGPDEVTVRLKPKEKLIGKFHSKDVKIEKTEKSIKLKFSKEFAACVLLLGRD